MKTTCPKCGSHDVVTAHQREEWFALAESGGTIRISTPCNCAQCGTEVSRTLYPLVWQTGPPPDPRDGFDQQNVCEETHFVIGSGSRVQLRLSGVSHPSHRVIYPMNEGVAHPDHIIDQYGDPDLMAECADEYLNAYERISFCGSVPRHISVMMPVLNLLVNAAELAIKAHLIRTDTANIRGHSLTELYARMKAEHRKEVERRFWEIVPFRTALSKYGLDGPTACSVLRRYGGCGINGRIFSVYAESRYFAEPTSRIKDESWKNASVLKVMPYPIYLPFLIRALLDGYSYFSVGGDGAKTTGSASEGT